MIAAVELDQDMQDTASPARLAVSVQGRQVTACADRRDVGDHVWWDITCTDRRAVRDQVWQDAACADRQVWRDTHRSHNGVAGRYSVAVGKVTHKSKHW